MDLLDTFGVAGDPQPVRLVHGALAQGPEGMVLKPRLEDGPILKAAAPKLETPWARPLQYGPFAHCRKRLAYGFRFRFPCSSTQADAKRTGSRSLRSPTGIPLTVQQPLERGSCGRTSNGPGCPAGTAECRGTPVAVCRRTEGQYRWAGQNHTTWSPQAEQPRSRPGVGPIMAGVPPEPEQRPVPAPDDAGTGLQAGVAQLILQRGQAPMAFPEPDHEVGPCRFL